MIWKLTRYSIIAFLRNRQALFFTLFMPLFIMLIFGYIGFDKPPVIDVGLVTYNPSQETKAFVEQIKKFPAFTIHEGSQDEELAQLAEGNRAAVLEIPDYLVPKGPQLPQERQSIVVHKNAGQAGQAETVVTILNQFIDRATITAANVEPQFDLMEKEVNANNLRYIEFLLPGLIALSIMQMSVFSVAFVFTQYKEKGVLKRILATPMKPFQFVAANAITRLMISVVQALIFILVALLLFKVHVVGSYILLLFVVILGALMFLGLGFTISGLAKTVDSVPAIANLIVFPMLFLGGTFFAVSNMPPWLQAFAQFLPLTYFSSALREIMTKGAGIFDIQGDIMAMIIWGAILFFLSTVTFRFQERESA